MQHMCGGGFYRARVRRRQPSAAEEAPRPRCRAGPLAASAAPPAHGPAGGLEVSAPTPPQRVGGVSENDHPGFGFIFRATPALRLALRLALLLHPDVPSPIPVSLEAPLLPPTVQQRAR